MDKKSHPNGTGRFTFKIPMKDEGVYEIAIAVTKKGYDTKRFTYTSDFSKGNFYFLTAPGKDHWWGNVRHYVYDALPLFFHENQG